MHLSIPACGIHVFLYHSFIYLITLPQLGGTFCITYSVCQATVQDIPKVLTEMDNDNNTSKLIMHIFFGKNLENKMNVFVEGKTKSH